VTDLGRGEKRVEATDGATTAHGIEYAGGRKTFGHRKNVVGGQWVSVRRSGDKGGALWGGYCPSEEPAPGEEQKILHDLRR